MHYCHMCGEGWCFFPMIFFIALIIFFVIMFRKRGFFCNWRRFRSKWMQDFFTDRYKSRTFESATDILKKRYASGEISKEEFERLQMVVTPIDSIVSHIELDETDTDCVGGCPIR